MDGFCKTKKTEELTILQKLAKGDLSVQNKLKENKRAMESKRTSSLIHNKNVENRCKAISEDDAKRKSPFPVRKKIQHKELNLPLYPTTTIGSFLRPKKYAPGEQNLEKENYRQRNTTND